MRKLLITIALAIGFISHTRADLPYLAFQSDIQQPDQQFHVKRAFAGATPMLRWDLFNGGKTNGVDFTGFTFTFWYGNDASATTGVTVSQFKTASNSVYFLSATNFWAISQDAPYYCEVVGINTNGQKIVFNGTMNQVWSPFAGTPASWNPVNTFNWNWIQKYLGAWPIHAANSSILITTNDSDSSINLQAVGSGGGGGVTNGAGLYSDGITMSVSNSVLVTIASNSVTASNAYNLAAAAVSSVTSSAAGISFTNAGTVYWLVNTNVNFEGRFAASTNALWGKFGNYVSKTGDTMSGWLTLPGYNWIGNTNNEPTSAILSGNGNTIPLSADHSVICGGFLNLISGYESNIGGGDYNNNSGNYAVIDGGYNNYNISDYAAISGGYDNNNNGSYSSIAGGWGNTNSGNFAIILGGYNNQAYADNTLAAGYRATAAHANSFVWGGAQGAQSHGTDSVTFAAASGMWLDGGKFHGDGSGLTNLASSGNGFPLTTNANGGGFIISNATFAGTVTNVTAGNGISKSGTAANLTLSIGSNFNMTNSGNITLTGSGTLNASYITAVYSLSGPGPGLTGIPGNAITSAIPAAIINASVANITTQGTVTAASIGALTNAATITASGLIMVTQTITDAAGGTNIVAIPSGGGYFRYFYQPQSNVNKFGFSYASGTVWSARLDLKPGAIPFAFDTAITNLSAFNLTATTVTNPGCITPFFFDNPGTYTTGRQ